MDVVLVGLPGSGKTEVGRRLAKRLGASFVDTDREVEQLAGRPIDGIFEASGESGFRVLDRRVVASLGTAEGGDAAAPRRVVATGGGTVVDPRNRWQLYRGRRVVWLDAPVGVLADRLRRSPTVRPLLTGRDLDAGLAELRLARERFYAAGERVDASGGVAATIEAIEAMLTAPAPATPLLRAELAIGSTILGEGIATSAIDAELRRLGARRVVLVTEPRAWTAVGGAVAAGLAALGWRIDRVELPEGEAAKRLSVVEAAAGELARLGVERDEPVVAVGGGALTDVAGFVAATYHRGIPWIAVPTTLLGQLDAAHGGKTGVDLDLGKNLVGAFHLPAAVVVDVALLATLPERHRRAALAEAVKDGLLGDERLLEVLEQQGAAVARGTAAPDAAEPSALAEIVERAAWTKLASVAVDPLEQGDRIKLNLGHTLGHAIEAVAGFGPVLHGEAVAYGLRAAVRLGAHLGVTPAARASRTERLLDVLALATDPLELSLDAVLAVLDRDKKRRAGTMRWVLPTADGWSVVDGIDAGLVRTVAASVLAGRAPATPAAAPALATGGAR